MGFIEDMKWWHWILVSLLIGAAFGYIHSTVDIDSDRTLSPRAFEIELMAQPDKLSGPLIQDIMVYPPQPGKDNGTVQLITFKYFDEAAIKQKKIGAPLFQDGAIMVKLPFGPQGCAAIDRPNSRSTWPGTKIYVAQKGDDFASLTKTFYGTDTGEFRNLIKDANAQFVRARSANDLKFIPGDAYFIPLDPRNGLNMKDFLNEAKATAPWIKYRFAWWHIPRLIYPTWMGGSLILIGLIWPAIIRVLASGGLGREKDRSDYDISRFPGRKTPAPVKAAVAMTEDDNARLLALEASLEASLKASGNGPSAPAEVKTEAPIKQLTTAPVTAPAPAPAPEKPKQYKGEYYPVVKSVEKKK